MSNHVSFSNRFWVSILDNPHRVYRLRLNTEDRPKIRIFVLAKVSQATDNLRKKRIFPVSKLRLVQSLQYDK
jgi:desulfoferrodoxin (superoxide reductase-like protein)